MQRRKASNRQRPSNTGSGAAPTLGPGPTTAAHAKGARPADGTAREGKPAPSEQGPAAQRVPEAGAVQHPRAAALDLVSAVAALLLLLFCHKAAVRLLAPQTGDWLASSFCSLALFSLAGVAAVVGHVAEEGATVLASIQAGTGAGTAAPTLQPRLGTAACAWWIAAAAAALLSAPAGGPPASLAGRLVLAPGLADDGAVRMSDPQLTVRAMALAAVLLGPLFLAVGCAAGASGGQALQRLLGRGVRAQLLLLPMVVGAAAFSLFVGLPGWLVPPRPASTLPPIVAAVAAAMAAALTPVPNQSPAASGAGARGKKGRQAGRQSSSRISCGQSKTGRWQRSLALALAASALALAAHRALTPQCSAALSEAVQVEGGRYTVLQRCEAAGGGRLAVVEGTYKGQYRYRLLRMDHSVLGGEYVAPADVAGQPIYTAFYLQQAAVLFNPNGTRSLHVGLGVGTAVKGMQRVGITADSLELVPEVFAAAERHFGLQPRLNGGRAIVGDALVEVPRLVEGGQAGSYDYILHDIFTGGGMADPLMDIPMFRQLSALLAPAGGVLAVNYYGGKGQGLKDTWCRLRLVFDSVRAFADVEKSRVRNHVLFASNDDLGAANLTAAVLAAAERQAAAEVAGGPEVFDPLQLRLWRALRQQEVKLTYDRQRCAAMLRRSGAPGRRPGRDNSELDGMRQPGGGRSPGPGGLSGSAGRHGQQGREAGGGKQQGRQHQPPALWLRLKAMRERHLLAVTHWVAMRSQFADSLWLS